MESDSSAVDAQSSAQGKAPPERKFYCTFDPNCKSRFSRSEHLQRHIRKHTGERPFKCDCGRTFSRMDNLRQHAQTVHAGDETNLAAWPATKILPVTPVAPLPAEARVQHRSVSAGATPTGKSTSSSVKPVGVLASGKKDGKSGTANPATTTATAPVAVRSAPGSAGKRVGSSGQRAVEEVRPYPKASDRPKKSPRHATAPTAVPTKSTIKIQTTRKGRERNYESFMNNLSLYRPSILHHLDESQHDGVYGKRRSMGHQPASTQPPSLLAPAEGEPLAVPPYHSVRSAELPPIVSFDRYTPGRFDDAKKSAAQEIGEKQSMNSSSNASQTSTTRKISPGEIGQTKFSGAMHGNLAKARQMSIASLCSTDDSSSSDAVMHGTRPLQFGHHMQQHESIFARERQLEQMRAATIGSPASRPSNNQTMQVLSESAATAAT